MARELFEDQRSERQQDGVGAGHEQITPGAKTPQSSSRGGLQTQLGRGGAIGPGDGAESSVATGSATAQPVDGRTRSQSSESNNTFSQSGVSMQERPDWEKAGLRPLNPFMVPLKLLARHNRK